MIPVILQYFLPRTLVMLLVSTWLLTFLAAYLYVFKQPLKSYSEERETLGLLERNSVPEFLLEEAIKEEKKQIEFYQDQLNQADSNQPTNLLVARVIGQLDQLASQSAVQLVSVDPGKTGRVLRFDEMPFQIQINGSYFQIYQWLRTVEETLKPMVVKKFEISRSSDQGLRQMSLTLVSYRLKR